MDLNEQGWNVDGKSRSTHTQTEYLLNTGQTCDVGQTCGHGHNQTPNESMSSAVGSPAKTLASLEKGQELMEHEADCGVNTQESFAKWDRELSSWRTSQLCLFEGLTEFSERWPTSGTMRNGRVSRRVPLVPHIHEIGCSSLPTVVKSDGTGQAGILTERMEFVTDSITGKPRRLAPCGGTWSAGLSRLWKMAAGSSLPPSVAEWLMGFPIGWSELEDAEMPSSHKSPN